MLPILQILNKINQVKIDAITIVYHKNILIKDMDI